MLFKHYAIAACVEYQACTIWLVSVYIPPNSSKLFVASTLQTILTLDNHPVFVGGDFNRSDQHHFQTWDNFLVQAGLTDVDPLFPTYKYQEQESALDRFLVPGLFLDTAQLFARIYGRYRIDTCHHKALMLRLKMKPRLRPHPQSEKHHTIPTQVFLDPTATSEGPQDLARQAALFALKRKVSLAQKTKIASLRFHNIVVLSCGVGGGITPVTSKNVATKTALQVARQSTNLSTYPARRTASVV